MRIPAITLALLFAAGCTAPDTDTGGGAGPAAEPPVGAPAPAPAPAPVPDPADAATVPERFHGDYAANAEACAMPGHESRLAIAATRIEFHESSGEVIAADVSGNDIGITASVTGEGETRDVGYSFSLSDDGRALTDSVNGLTRERCGAELQHAASQ